MTDRIEEYVVDIRTEFDTHTADPAAHHDAPDDTAFAATWNADTDTAPSKNAVYDAITGRLNYPMGVIISCGNGTLLSQLNGKGLLYLPAADNNCFFNATILVPDNWLVSDCYIKAAYCMSDAVNGYSGTWSVASHAIGEVCNAYNILNASAVSDFAVQTPAYELHINSVTLAGIAAGDVIGVNFTSDANNGADLRVFAIWLSPNIGVDVQ